MVKIVNNGTGVVEILIMSFNLQSQLKNYNYLKNIIYRNTSGSFGEREIEVGTRAHSTSVSTLFRVLANFHECFYNVREHGKKCFLFLL